MHGIEKRFKICLLILVLLILQQHVFMYTTNEEDQRKAAELKTRLAEQPTSTSSSNNNIEEEGTSFSSAGSYIIPSVSIDEGANKYVLIRAKKQGSREDQHFVVSSRGAHYHRDAAEPMIDVLQHSGYRSIEVLGGGRIRLVSSERKMEIFGFSYGFGGADHNISARVVQADLRFKDFEITTSNEGY